MMEDGFLEWSGLYGRIDKPVGLVDIKFRDGEVRKNERAEEWDWLGGNGFDDIVAYRPALSNSERTDG